MADDTTGAAVQAQAVADDLLRDLQATVAAPTDASAAAGPTAADIARVGKQAVARIAQAAEDAYWTPRRQLEQAINTRNTAAARVGASEERIAQLKQQIGA